MKTTFRFKQKGGKVFFFFNTEKDKKTLHLRNLLLFKTCRFLKLVGNSDQQTKHLSYLEKTFENYFFILSHQTMVFLGNFEGWSHPVPRPKIPCPNGKIPRMMDYFLIICDPKVAHYLGYIFLFGGGNKIFIYLKNDYQ